MLYSGHRGIGVGGTDSTAGTGAPGGQLAGALAAFEPVTLGEMAQNALMDRAELKYVFPQSALPAILAELYGSYRVLTIGGRRQAHYRTLYFDTPDLALYMRHHAGAPDRYKVRSREYVDSRTAFFEIKHRTPNRRTQKSRIQTAGLLATPGGPVTDFLMKTCPYPARELQASLWNTYTRTTLVSRTRPERVTLDLNVAYAWEDESLALPGIVIAEVKYDPHRAREGAWGSPFVSAMREHGIRPTGFSKYCVGLSLLCPNLKHNRFKREHLLIERMVQGA